MDAKNLRELSPRALDEYVWKRLRREPPLNPPLGSRFGDEEPEAILLEAARTDPDTSSAFRKRLLEAIQTNLQRLAGLLAAAGASFPADEKTDEQVASLAFLIADLEAVELRGALYHFALSWILGEAPRFAQASFGQTHVLRTLAQLTPRHRGMDNFWRDFWDKGPPALRGIAIYGWARANPEEALERLGELADSAPSIDLPATVWSLVGPDCVGPIELGRAAALCAPEHREALRQALLDAGAPEDIVRHFNEAAKPASVKQGEMRGLAPAPSFNCNKLPAWAT